MHAMLETSPASPSPQWFGDSENRLTLSFPEGSRASFRLRLHEGGSVTLGSVIAQPESLYQFQLGTIDGSKQSIAARIIPGDMRGEIGDLGDINDWEFKPWTRQTPITRGYGKTSVYVAQHAEHGDLYLDVEVRKP